MLMLQTWHTNVSMAASMMFHGPEVTDADLVLGRLETGSLALGEVDLKLSNAETAIATVAQRLKVEVAAQSIAEAVEDSLVTAAQAHAAEHGLDLPQHVLVAFGGAAPLRAARLAERLGIETVLIPPDASVGSAVGFFSAPLAFEAIESCKMTLQDFDHSKVNAIFRQLWHKTVSVVAAGAARWKPGRPPKERRRAYLRYVGQGHEVCIDLPNRDLEAEDPKKLQQDFELEYARLGFIALPEEIEFRAFALEVVADADPLAWPRERLQARQKLTEQSMLHSSGEQGVPKRSNTVRVVYDNDQQLEHEVYFRSDLGVGDFIRGPAVICEPYTTTICSNSFDCWVLENGFLQLQARGASPKLKHFEHQVMVSSQALSFRQDESPEHTIHHRLAWTRLLSIVEEQARTTLRNSFTTLLRECRGVGCAVLNESGQLLAHSEISSPSLTGVLLFEVQTWLEDSQTLSRGECMIRVRAGSMPHHSDLIVLTPVFQGDEPCGYLASVAHVTKMPKEKACVVNRGTLLKLGSYAQDVAALIASNELGLRRLLTLFAERGVTISSLGRYIFEKSRTAIMKNLQFEAVPSQTRSITIQTNTGSAVEVHQVQLTAEINCFSGGLKVNLSAQYLNETTFETLKGSPAFLCVSLCKFALMAVLGQGVPVNSGSLDVFQIQIPSGSILDAAPGECEDVDASQVASFLPDLLIHCLSSKPGLPNPADSASCLSTMCWKTKRDSKFGLHIEGGGMGAQSDQDGLSCCIFPSGLQSMPLEIAEMSSGSMLFSCKELIPDSGGAGCFRGGLGVRSELVAQCQVSGPTIRSACCRDGPTGRDGGFAGKPFSAEVKRKQFRDPNGDLDAGDLLVLETPGGGGYGPPAKRCRQSILRDLEEGYISHAAAVSLYQLEDAAQK